MRTKLRVMTPSNNVVKITTNMEAAPDFDWLIMSFMGVCSSLFAILVFGSGVPGGAHGEIKFVDGTVVEIVGSDSYYVLGWPTIVALRGNVDASSESGENEGGGIENLSGDDMLGSGEDGKIIEHKLILAGIVWADEFDWRWGVVLELDVHSVGAGGVVVAADTLVGIVDTNDFEI